MIRLFILTLALALWATPGQACDGCGCSISGGGVGLMTQANARYLGINYRHSLFELGAHSGSELTRDQFTDVQLVARFGIASRFLIEGSLPYRMISRSGDEALPVDEEGIGDARLLLNYILFDEYTTKGNPFFWSFGAGFSAPTGSYNGTYDDAIPDHLNPGSGAWGLQLQSMISLQPGNWGFNSQFAANIRQRNSANYRFGNQWTNTTLAFWRKTWDSIALAPFAGVYSEFLQNGQRNGRAEDPSTAGWGQFISTGVEAKIGKINLGAQIQIPVWQEYAEGESQSKSRLSFTLAFLM